MPAPSKSLIERMVQGLTRPSVSSSKSDKASILALAASAYSARPAIDDVTMPTGFDPAAVALFEALVEAAFLVANADGDFDDDERAGFQAIVINACQNLVHVKQLEALVADLCELFGEDGMEKRLRMVTRTVTRPEHQREVIRVAALMAHASGGASPEEREVLDKLAQGFQLDASVVDEALAQAAESLKIE